MSDGDDKPFLIGITMAGAVSAGAYTAGVLDYLFRAIDAHNANVAPADAAPDDPRPRHRVVVKVMSGSSAGGVSAGLAVAGLIEAQAPGAARLRPPETKTARDWRPEGKPEAEITYDVSLAPLHAVWVKLVDLWKPAGGPGLLGQRDLGNEETVRSIFDGTHLDEAAERALEDITWGSDVAGGQPYDFLASDLELFLTTTNLSGVPFEVAFAGQTSGGQAGSHRMANHSTVRHFRVQGLGTYEVRSAWLEMWRDDGITLALPERPGGRVPFVPPAPHETRPRSPEAKDPPPEDPPAGPWEALTLSAITTGAFPVGLPSRLIGAEASELGVLDKDGRARGGAMPIDVGSPERVSRPDFGGLPADDRLFFVAVDGGAANNEPFEYARFTLRELNDKNELERNPREREEATRAVIMVDPFPEGPTFEHETEAEVREGLGLFPSLSALLPALINQARFKPSELINATAEDVRSRFLVRPTRSDPLGDPNDTAGLPVILGHAAIASGGFGGFSGFFDESFRLHDFVLGQENCKSFLTSDFTLGVDNPILKLPDGHPRKSAHDGECPVVFLDVPIDGTSGPTLAETEITVPSWPRLSNGRIDLLLRKGQERLEKVGAATIRSSEPGWFFSFLLNRVWRGGLGLAGLERRVAENLAAIVLAGLVARDQLEDFVGIRADLRRLVITLIRAKGEALSFDALYRATFDGLGSEGGSTETPESLRVGLERLADKGAILRINPLFGAPRYAHPAPAFKIGLWTRARRAIV